MKVDPFKLTKLSDEYLIEVMKLSNVYRTHLASIVLDYVSLYNHMVEYERSLDENKVLSLSQKEQDEIVTVLGRFTELLRNRYPHIETVSKFIDGNTNNVDKIKKFHESHMSKPYVKEMKFDSNSVNLKE